MFSNLRFIVSGLLVSAACAQALDATNLTKHKPKCGAPKPSQGLPVDTIRYTASITGHTPNITGHTPDITSDTDLVINYTSQCGTPGLSSQEWTELRESLDSGHNMTKRQGLQRYNVPTYITVVAKNYTIAGGYLNDSQIKGKLDEFEEYWSFGFRLDPSVDQIHRHVRPDLFDARTNFLKPDLREITKEFHRGPGDYASLNMIFVFRYHDQHDYIEYGNGGYQASSSGAVGVAIYPGDQIWKYSNWAEVEKEDGIVISSAIIREVAHKRSPGVKGTIAHEFGHWLGLGHTDSPRRKGQDEVTDRTCEPNNDGIDDTPTHVLSQIAMDALSRCPQRAQVTTCRQYDARPDPLYNLMVSMSGGDCPTDDLTPQQKERAMAVYKDFRLPFKQQMEQRGLWVENRQQANNQAQPQPNLQQQGNAQNEQREACLRQADADSDKRFQEALRGAYDQLMKEYDLEWQRVNRYSHYPQYHRWVMKARDRTVNDYTTRWKQYKDPQADHWRPYHELHQTARSRC